MPPSAPTEKLKYVPPGLNTLVATRAMKLLTKKMLGKANHEDSSKNEEDPLIQSRKEFYIKEEVSIRGAKKLKLNFSKKYK